MTSNAQNTSRKITRVCQTIAMFEFITGTVKNPFLRTQILRKNRLTENVRQKLSIKTPFTREPVLAYNFETGSFFEKFSQSNNTVPCINVAFCSVYLGQLCKLGKYMLGFLTYYAYNTKNRPRPPMTNNSFILKTRLRAEGAIDER